ncbi:hypothetical protein [Streptomyces sp. NPDC056982]|uniref:hypothetical protein n=1 Tax=Streptomyces sp. NPDC056982 TaxID=3345986 RepID=UPI00362E567B
MTDETTPETLILVGWYCWRCEGLNAQACRSDCVPIHVPAEWVDDMLREIRRLEDEDDEPGSAAPDGVRHQYAARAFNAVGPALKAHDQWLPLSVRKAVADAVLTVRDRELDGLKAEVTAARKFAGEMRDFCSPHGVATDYADRLIEAMDRAKGEQG